MLSLTGDVGLRRDTHVSVSVLRCVQACTLACTRGTLQELFQVSLQSGFRRWAGVCRGVSAGAQPNSKLWAPQHSLRAPSPSGPSFLAACGRGRRATGHGFLLCDREGSSSWSGPGSGSWLGRRTGLITGSGHGSSLPAGVDHTLLGMCSQAHCVEVSLGPSVPAVLW